MSLSRSRLAIVPSLLQLLFCVSVGFADDPVKVGILGLDNYQAVAYAQLFNNPKAEGDLAGLKVVAAYPYRASEDIPESVESLPKWKEQIQKFGVELVDSVDEVLQRSDAVMIMTLDGRTHLELAKPALAAGKRLYIGRPMAASLPDVIEMFRLSESTKTPCFSCSQHRYSPGFVGMKNHPEVGRVIGCDVYGGCVTEPGHSEFFWHAVHGIDTLSVIMGPGCVSVRCTSTPTAEIVTGVWADGRVGTFRGIKEGKLKYSATVFGVDGVSTAGVYGHGVPSKGIVPTTDKYMGYEGVAIEMAKFFKGDAPPVSPAETLEVFAILEAAKLSKAQQGAEVMLKSVLDHANATP